MKSFLNYLLNNYSNTFPSNFPCPRNVLYVKNQTLMLLEATLGKFCIQKELFRCQYNPVPFKRNPNQYPKGLANVASSQLIQEICTKRKNISLPLFFHEKGTI